MAYEVKRATIFWILWSQAIYLQVVLENQVTFVPVTLIHHLETSRWAHGDIVFSTMLMTKFKTINLLVKTVYKYLMKVLVKE